MDSQPTEASLTKTKGSTNLWIERETFRRQFDIMTIQKNNRNRSPVWPMTSPATDNRDRSPNDLPNYRQQKQITPVGPRTSLAMGS